MPARKRGPSIGATFRLFLSRAPGLQHPTEIAWRRSSGCRRTLEARLGEGLAEDGVAVPVPAQWSTDTSRPHSGWSCSCAMRTIVVAAILVGLLGAPAIAATHYWVAKDTSTKTCTEVSMKPDGVKMTAVGKKTYSSYSSADKAPRASTACKS